MYPLPHKTQFVNEIKPSYSFIPEYKNICVPKELAYDFYTALKDFAAYTDIDEGLINTSTYLFKHGITGNYQIMIARQRFGGLFADEYACLVINPSGNFIFTFDSDDFNFKAPLLRNTKEKHVLLEIAKHDLNSDQYKLLVQSLAVV